MISIYVSGTTVSGNIIYRTQDMVLLEMTRPYHGILMDALPPVIVQLRGGNMKSPHTGPIPLQRIPIFQDFGPEPNDVRETDHYQAEYVALLWSVGMN